jgi:hypothetical protein
VIVTVLNRGKALKHMVTQSAISVQRDSRFMARVLSVFAFLGQCLTPLGTACRSRLSADRAL